MPCFMLARRSVTVQTVLFCAHTLYMSYVSKPETVVMARCSQVRRQKKIMTEAMSMVKLFS